MSKPSIPKGTRDFLPEQMAKRKYIFSTIENVFKTYGFLPIETPSMEKTETLMGKYGEEGDRLIFKILNSGDFLKSVQDDSLHTRDLKGMLPKVSEKALRYDLTVPFARFVVQNQNEITFPFKRYQIQPVWRADRPQRGRYREFYQCDVDIIGSNSLLNEVELIQIFDDVLTDLKLTDFTIKLNNRKILSGIAEVVGEKEKIIDITVAIDKLDKIGVDKVKDELRTKEISEQAIEKLTPLLTISGSNEELINTIAELVSASEEGRKGVEELKEVLSKVAQVGLQNAKIEFTPSLARGLNYYTGAIFEVSANNVKIGSICGGGRYDDLTSIFGLKGISGVGISFGADRIYDVLDELNLFPETLNTFTKIMFVNFGEEESTHCLGLVKALRSKGISSELYPDSAKMKKQMTYANNKSIPYVALIGTKEIESNVLTVKNMITGEQNEFTIESLINELT
jgi:histidyl-tRNA synthetase